MSNSEPKREPSAAEMGIGLDENLVAKRSSSFAYKNREYLAEFLGTMLLVLFGDGAIAQNTVTRAGFGSTYLSVDLGFAFGLTTALFVTSPISGGHLNPAITIAKAVFGKFDWKKAPGYIFAQNLGGFVASAILYMIYWPAMTAFDGGVRQTTGMFRSANIFATYPSAESPLYNSFIVETAITAIFMICYLGITDVRQRIPNHVSAIAIGLSLGAVGLSLGIMSEFALNPARDFGPRFFTLITGWGWETFSAGTYYFWVPIVGPTAGACIGNLLYNQLIYPEESDE